MSKPKRLPRVGVAVPLLDVMADLQGDNSRLIEIVVARLEELRRISAGDQIRVVTWTLCRRAPARVDLDIGEVWLVVQFEKVG